MDVTLLEDASDAQLLEMRQLQAKTSFLFLAASDTARSLDLALSAGGRGYMLKASSAPELLNGIRRIASSEEGDEPASTNATADLKALADSGQRYARTAALTSREQEILRLLAEGRTVRESASELALSIKTIEAHKLNLMRKLNIHNRSTLIEYAAQNGILPAVPVLS